MHAEILAIGSEIISGQLLDTNTQWLSQRLEELGIRVLYHSSVGDELEPLVEVFRRAIDRCQIVVSTGGLGPTADDLTREALAQAVGQPLVLNEQALAHVREIFARRKREMPKRNERQAFFPAGSRMVPNPHGTAPGIELDTQRPPAAPVRVIALPGVPAEMKEMWHHSVGASLRTLGAGGRMIRHKQIKCFGAGESQIEALLPEGFFRQQSPRVGINASQTTIILRIAAEGATQQQCRAAMEPLIATVHRCLGTLVFGEDDEELQHVVVGLLRQRQQTLAVAEWGTTGLVTQWLAGVPEAGGRFLGGVVVAGDAAVKNLLGVFEKLAKGFPLPVGEGQGDGWEHPHPNLLPEGEETSQTRAGATAGSPSNARSDKPTVASSEVVQAMAAGCRERFGADYGLAVGGMGILPGQETLAPATCPCHAADPAAAEPRPVFFALAGPDGIQVQQAPLAGHPATLQAYCAKHALNMLRLALLKR
jgi:nicotinamide-nucleotide amidase